MFTFGSDIFGCQACGVCRARDDLVRDAARVWPARIWARGTAVVAHGIRRLWAAAGLARKGSGCYGGPAARLARVWRRRLRVLGGRPSAALRAVSAWRAP